MTFDVCGCCEPPARLTPLAIENRPGLSAIAYRIGTYSSFRRSMLHAIAGTPELAPLSTRLSDDYAITVLELWASVAHVLSFYQERAANESFWRTARLRDSLLRMARLIDYQLGPGVAATTLLAFTLEKAAKTRIPIGLRVQSVPGQDEKPQKFETLEAIAADARLNLLRVVPAPIGVNPLAKGSTEAILAPGAAALALMQTLAPGDHFILFAPGAKPIEELEVRELRVERDRVILSWTAPVQGAFWNVVTTAFKARRTFRFFGYNAPTMVTIASLDASQNVVWTLEETDYTYSGGDLLLDGPYKDIAVGSPVLVVVDGVPEAIRIITSVGESSETLLGTSATPLDSLAARVTKLIVSPVLAQISDRRQVQIYELGGPPIHFWGHTYPASLSSGSVYLPGRKIAAAQIEVGQAIERKALQPGTRIGLDEIERGRRVIVHDDRQLPVSATIAKTSIVASEVTCAPTAADTTTVAELGLLPNKATAITGLISQSLTPFPTLSQLQPQLAATIGRIGPRTIDLTLPLDIFSLASQLQAGINAADPSPGFAQARVFLVDNDRLVVLPGMSGFGVTIGTTLLDPATAIDLGLAPGLASTVSGLASAALDPFPVLTSPAPEMTVTIGPASPHTISLAPPPATHQAAAAQMQIALNTSGDPSPFYSQARVVTLDNRLLVLPGVLGADVQAFLTIELEPDQYTTLETASAVLLGNIARASHGETVKEEILGDGDATVRFQQFALKKKPLTYVPSASAGGVSSSLKVFVNRALWAESPSLFGNTPASQVHTTRIGDDGTATVRFGDGITGARPLTGRGNVLAVYRHGLGLAGRVRARTLTTILDKPVGLKSTINPLPAEGGADPETLDEARENAPSTVRTFGRIVSLHDFEDLATASGEVYKAKAGWLWSAEGQVVHLTVAGQQAGQFSAEGRRRLHDSLTAARDPNHTLIIDNFIRIPIVISATIHVSPSRIADDVGSAARTALVDALSFGTLRFGQRVHLSDIYKTLQDVPGVDWLTVDLLQFKDQSPAFLASRGADDQPVQAHLRIYPARLVPGPPATIVPAEQAWIEVPGQDITVLTSGGLSL